MNVIKLTNIDRTYKNNGQHAEQVFRFTLSGEIVKADNKPAELCGDYLDIQIKSARATVCNGDNLMAYLEMDSANKYAYIVKDFSIAYLMNKTEWKAFCEQFGRIEQNSQKNGGKVKIRLTHEGYEMREWLERATR